MTIPPDFWPPPPGWRFHPDGFYVPEERFQAYEEDLAKSSLWGTRLAQLRWAQPDADRDQPRRAGLLGGRPKEFTRCQGCGYVEGARAMRLHKCPDALKGGQPGKFR